MQFKIKTVLFFILALLLGISETDAKEFLVGSELPLTGAFARAGGEMNEGSRVAAEMFNRHHPNHRIKIITIDNESSPAKAISAVEKLVSMDVIALTGGYGSNLIGPAAQTANKAGLVYVTSGGIASQLCENGLQNFFRINNTPGYTKALTGLLVDQGIKSVSVVFNTKEATSGLAETVHKGLSAKGIKVAMHPFDPGILDFKSIINKIKLQDRSEAIAMVAYENDYVAILRALNVMKPTTIKTVVGGWALATPRMSSEFASLVPNVYGTALLPYPAEFKTAEGKEFYQIYKELFNKAPSEDVQFGFVHSQILFEAILRAYDAGCLNNGCLANEMRKTEVETLIGPVSFNSNGDNASFMQMMGQHQDGKIVVVWPKEYANGQMKFPATSW